MQLYYNETSRVMRNCSAPNSFHKAAVCKCGSDFPLCQLRREAHSPALCHYDTKFPVIAKVSLQAPWLEQKGLAIGQQRLQNTAVNSDISLPGQLTDVHYHEYKNSLESAGCRE